MRQIMMSEYGGPDVLKLAEVPDPAPGPGEVLIRVSAIGMTFVETQVRAGRPPWPGALPPLPRVPGNGVAGTIIAVGPDTDPALVGTRVVTATGGEGGYAELAVVRASEPLPIPDGVDGRTAVALLADGRTALGLLRAAAIQPGDRVAVTVAGGGVGSLLTQLTHAAGAAPVVALAGGRRKLDLARELGADITIDYRRDGWEAELQMLAGGLDVVFDGVGGRIGAKLLGHVAPGGRFLAYGGASGTLTDVASKVPPGVTIVPGYTVVQSPADARSLAEQALAMASAGQLHPVIGQTFPLSRAAEAHATIEARATLGKTLLIPD